MKARAAIITSSALLGLTAFAAPAAAAPPGAGLDTFQATCGGLGVVTVTTGRGASFWLGDQHYLLTSFNPTTGPGTFQYGHRTGLQGTEIQCIGTTLDGVTVNVTAVAVP